MRTQGKNKQSAQSAGKRERPSHNWFWFLIGREGGTCFLNQLKDEIKQLFTILDQKCSKHQKGLDKPKRNQNGEDLYGLQMTNLKNIIQIFEGTQIVANVFIIFHSVECKKAVPSSICL